MKKLLLLALLTSACASSGSKPIVPPSVETIRTVATIVETESHSAVVGAECKIQIDVAPGIVDGTTSDTGYVSWQVPGRIESTNILCSKPDFDDLTVAVTLPKDQNIQLPNVTMTQPHVDPRGFSLEQLAAVRGALFTARYPLPWGPRPSDPSNIINIGEVFGLANKADRTLVFDSYKSRGYTHAAMGPWLPDADQNYHGIYPNHNWTFDQFLDQLQELWDNGLTPIVFIKPDNWSCGQLEGLTQFYSQARAQKLVRFKVAGGWEPSKGTSNAEWACWLGWGQRVLPNAVSAIHMEADFDAPGNNDDFTPGQPNFIGMPEAWNRVAPFLHLYLIQSGGYVFGGDQTPSDSFKQSFCALFGGRAGIQDRFTNGYAGWPTSSAWGVGKPIRAIAGEYASFGDFWNNWPEATARTLGDLAMSCGAYGYMDGGTVAVPVR